MPRGSSQSLLLASLLLAGCSGTRPASLGVKDGKLPPCPSTPNCVSSHAPSDDAEHYVEPLRYAGSRADALGRLLGVLADTPRVEVITHTEAYVYAEATSFLFRFVDDLELYLPAEEPGVVHVRSASRLGRSDLGVNRERVEELRSRFER